MYDGYLFNTLYGLNGIYRFTSKEKNPIDYNYIDGLPDDIKEEVNKREFKSAKELHNFADNLIKRQ